MVRYNHMKQGEFYKIVRERIARGMSVLTFEMKPTHKKQVESVIRETVKSIAEDIQKLENTNDDTGKLVRLREIDQEMDRLNQERIKILQ